MKTIAIVLFLWLAATAGQAQFTYTNVNGGYLITGYSGTNGAVTIPGTYNQLPVTGIGDTAFASNPNITSLTLSSNTASIGLESFINCTSLTNVTLDAGLSSIGYAAFSYCANLATLSVPAGVTSVGSDAFYGCSGLKFAIFLGNAPAMTNDQSIFSQGALTSVYYLYGTTGWGSRYGGVPTVLADPPPQVANQMQVAGGNATFSFVPTGLQPSTNQWYFYNPALQSTAGAVAEMYNGFIYGVVVTNGGSGYTLTPSVSFVGGGGQGAGGTATISNGMVVSITMTNANSGYTNLPVVVIGPPSGILVGQTATNLTVTNVGPTNLGDYYVVVSDAYGSVASPMATLSYAYPPTIINQPTNVMVEAGVNAVFSVTVSGTPAFRYQWWETGVQPVQATAVAVVTNGFVVGATITTNGAGYLTVPSMQITGGGGNSAGGYVLVGNQMVTTITITNAGFGYASPPTIVIPPPAGLKLTGKTANTLSFSNVGAANAANYYVVVTNGYGSVTSSVANLYILPPGYDLITNAVLNAKQMYISYVGLAGKNYALDLTHSLAPANWIPQVTNTAGMNGWLSFTNTPSPSTNNFWRVRSVP